MTHFMNARENLVTEAIDGLLAVSGGSLRRLDGYPHIKVVYRSDWNRSRVALLSGGGSGHEPAHAGFVGRGMLTAAICGEVFASPSVDAVLAGILAVTGDAGCLLIVKNYTGDRLNFGLAAERARALGRRVEMVVVDDDIALPNLPQARGIAGTLLVHKIAGACAEAGQSLEAVSASAKDVIGRLASIGMSLDTCIVPGSAKEDRIAAGNMELGLGIHGEAGKEQARFSGAREAMRRALEKLQPHLGGGPLVALLNNLGSTTPIEMSVLARELAGSPVAGPIKFVIGPAPLMTSLDMHGFSVSVMNLSDDQLDALRFPVTPVAWPGIQLLCQPSIERLPDGLKPVRPIASQDWRTRVTIESICDLLTASENRLNDLDAKSGDGDTGTTLAAAARSLKICLDKMPMADLTQLMPALGNELSQTMGGSSGVILAIFFNATGDACSRGVPIEKALAKGLERVSQVGGAAQGDRTMIDALQPALAALPEGLGKAAAAARAGADSTASITQAKAGRAAYVPAENLKGYNDPGAEAVALLFEGLLLKRRAMA